MTEMLNVQIVETGQNHTIPEEEPTESAKLFWHISDEIWQQRNKSFNSSYASTDSRMPALEARDAMNGVLGEINKKLVISGAGKTVDLHGLRPDENVTLSPGLLDIPSSVHIGTFNWDEGNTQRWMDIDGEEALVRFTDGHKDRYRELQTSFGYTDENNQTVQLTYSMQRQQWAQADATSLTTSIWCSSLAETGYEGNHLYHTSLSIEQELKVLGVFQAIGGIAIRASRCEQ